MHRWGYRVPKGDRKGRPRSRRNSRKASEHDFYASAVSEAERLRLDEAQELQGLDSEIALLRTRLLRLAQEQPEDTALLFRGLELLVKAVVAKYRLSPKSTEDLSTAIDEVLKSVGEAMGLEGFSGS